MDSGASESTESGTWLEKFCEDMYALCLFCVGTLVALYLLWTFTPCKEAEIINTSRLQRERHQHRQSVMARLGLITDNIAAFRPISDHFSHVHEVSVAMRKAGLEYCDLIIGIDFTASNEWQGRKTLNGDSLHSTRGNKIYNPYQRVIAILGETLECFTSKQNLIPAFGFGDEATRDHSIFSIKTDGESCKGFFDVLQCYNQTVQNVTLSGPTSFAPLIDKAVDIVKLKQAYHILVIIADGQMRIEEPTIKAIVGASNYGLSIIMVGVGDGPWDMMEEFDDHLPERKFDNFQFVNFHQTTRKAKNQEASFALHALMEIPAQYKAIKSLGYLDFNNGNSINEQL